MLKVTAKENKTKLGVEEKERGIVLSVLSVLANRAVLTKSSRLSKLIKWSNHRNSSNSCNSQSSVILSCYSLLFLCYPVFSYPVPAPVTFLFPLLPCLLLPCHRPCYISVSSVILSSLTLSPPPCYPSPFFCYPVSLTLSLLGYSVYRIVLTIRKGSKKHDNSVYYC